MPYDTIFFDLDGTLLDSRQGVGLSVQRTARELGVTLPPGLPPGAYIGPPLSHFIEHTLGFPDPADIERGTAAFRLYYEDRGLFEAELFPGIRELLEALHADGRRLCVVSSKPLPHVTRILDHFAITPLFEHIIAGELDERLNYKPRLVARALEIARPDPSRTLMVGDHAFDIQGGNENGIDSAAVDWGFGDPEELDAARPTHRVADARALSDLLFGKD